MNVYPPWIREDYYTMMSRQMSFLCGAYTQTINKGDTFKPIVKVVSAMKKIKHRKGSRWYWVGRVFLKMIKHRLDLNSAMSMDLSAVL